jgi:pre-rRNA-processing protein TSR3
MDGEPIQKEDGEKGLFLIDCNWIHVEKMVPKDANIQKRRIPSEWKTAYPRRSTHCNDPERGLATVEALFIFWAIVGKVRWDLLEHYHWKDEFIALNADLLSACAHPSR